ncbi:hypothetical protein ANN_26017 [Periplaneta americana]|uniref:Reverse transcriptase domain-containing protein n=1 Tax=Periplaneta americana TaxID=6978 RepID=A0ABQ8S578_PERAM|nr:hypothetical protein ANN_26017 [Periplaneta americana]
MFLQNAAGVFTNATRRVGTDDCSDCKTGGGLVGVEADTSESSSVHHRICTKSKKKRNVEKKLKIEKHEEVELEKQSVQSGAEQKGRITKSDNVNNSTRKSIIPNRSGVRLTSYFPYLRVLQAWYKGLVYQLFIDFKNVYDSAKREILYRPNIHFEFGIPKKVVRLIKICLSETYSRAQR